MPGSSVDKWKNVSDSLPASWMARRWLARARLADDFLVGRVREQFEVFIAILVRKSGYPAFSINCVDGLCATTSILFVVVDGTTRVGTREVYITK